MCGPDFSLAVTKTVDRVIFGHKQREVRRPHGSDASRRCHVGRKRRCGGAFFVQASSASVQYADELLLGSGSCGRSCSCGCCCHAREVTQLRSTMIRLCMIVRYKPVFRYLFTRVQAGALPSDYRNADQRERQKKIVSTAHSCRSWHLATHTRAQTSASLGTLTHCMLAQQVRAHTACCQRVSPQRDP